MSHQSKNEDQTPKKLQNLQEFLGQKAFLAAKTTPFSHKKEVSIPIIVAESEVIQMLMEQIATTNSILEQLQQRPKDLWLTHEEFMEFFGISDTTARVWRDKGKIGFFQYERKIMYHWSDIEKFLNENKKNTF